jgi:hypothetical protein
VLERRNMGMATFAPGLEASVLSIPGQRPCPKPTAFDQIEPDFGEETKKFLGRHIHILVQTAPNVKSRGRFVVR